MSSSPVTTRKKRQAVCRIPGENRLDAVNGDRPFEDRSAFCPSIEIVERLVAGDYLSESGEALLVGVPRTPVVEARLVAHADVNFSELPARVGCEAVGVVDQVGEGVEGIELGARYCTLPYFYDMKGASGDAVLIDARYLTKAPRGMSAVEAGSIWMQFMTAYYPIAELAAAAPGVNILVTAATSTAGLSALQIGSMKGATMIGTSRFEYNRDYLRSGGASHVYVGDGEGLPESILQFTDGVGVHAVFDSIGAGMIAQYSKALAKDAQLFTYGTLDEKLPELPMVELYQANATFKPYSLFNYIEDPVWKEKGLNFVYGALATDRIEPNVDRVFAMEQYREAWEYLRAPRKQHGKVMIEVGS